MFRDQGSADARIIARILEMSHGVDNPTTELLREIVSVFYNNGGSWESFFKSDPEQSKLLKMCIRTVMKKKNG